MKTIQVLDQNITIPNDWQPRDYQMPLWSALETFEPDSGGLSRFVSVCHRRWGKDLLGINWCASASATRVGTYWHMLPTQAQGRRIVWEGMTKDGRRFLDAFPGFGPSGQHVGLPGSWCSGIRKDDMSLSFANGSRYQVVGASDIDSLVGSNPIGIIMSEFPLYEGMKVWNLLRPILRENGGWCLWLFTPRGHNHGYTLAKTAMANESKTWFYQAQGVEDSIHKGERVVSDKAIEDERKDGMPEPMIQQEYYVSFEAPLVGAYYGELMSNALEDGRICSVPVEPGIVTHTMWDIGMRDATAIWFLQIVGKEIHIIDFEWSAEVGLNWYANMLGEKAVKRSLVYGRHMAPHDIEVREIGAPDGRSRKETARQLGIGFKVVKRHAVEDGRNAVRTLLPKCWFDKEHCKDGIEGMKGYTRKLLEGQTAPDGSPMYADVHEHNWATHPADAFRIGAMGLPAMRSTRQDSPSVKNVGQFV